MLQRAAGNLKLALIINGATEGATEGAIVCANGLIVPLTPSANEITSSAASAFASAIACRSEPGPLSSVFTTLMAESRARSSSPSKRGVKDDLRALEARLCCRRRGVPLCDPKSDWIEKDGMAFLPRKQSALIATSYMSPWQRLKHESRMQQRAVCLRLS